MREVLCSQTVSTILNHYSIMTVAVFAGLGSTALFSSSTQSTALIDAGHPEAKALLNACHTIFLDELQNRGHESEVDVGIDLQDFQHPEDLLQPPIKYHKNAVIQNVTLTLVQLIRYLSHSLKPVDTQAVQRSGTAGFCSGLLTAVTVASYGDTLQFLSYGQQQFRVSLLLGLYMVQQLRQICTANSIDTNGFPWCVIIDGLKIEQAEELIAQYMEKVLTSLRVYRLMMQLLNM